MFLRTHVESTNQTALQERDRDVRRTPRALIRWRRSLRCSAVAVAMLVIGVGGGVGGAVKAHAAHSQVAESEPTRVSLWDRQVPGTNVTYAELAVEGKSPDHHEPAMLPLPAPALAAGVGLSMAWLFRRRFGRR